MEMNIEGTPHHEKVVQKEPQKELVYDVRIFPYGVRPLPELLKDIQSLKPNEKLSLFEVYMGQKTDLAKNVKGLITPFGGKISKDEDKDKGKLEKASLSRLNEESTLTIIPYSEPKSNEFSFEYKTKLEDANTKVHFKPVFVINPDTLPAICLQTNDSTDMDIVSMDLSDFATSTKTGKYKGHKLAGIANYSSKNKEIITDNESGKTELESRLSSLFWDIKKQEKDFSNLLKKRLILDSLKNGISFDSDDISMDKFLQIPLNLEEGETHTLLDEMFSKISLENVLINISENGKLEEVFKSSYDRLMRENYMKYFRDYEKKQFTYGDIEHYKLPKKMQMARLKVFGLQDYKKTKSDVIKNELELIKQRVVDGNFAIDLLHFIPLYTNTNMHPEARTTRSINAAARFIRDSLKQCLKESKIEGISTFADAKKLIETDDLTLLEKKYLFFKKMDRQMLGLLSDKLGKTKRYVTRTWFESQNFIRQIGEMAKNVDPKLYNIYQFHESFNEISNASMVQTIFMGLGIDSKKNNSETLKRLRFESLRQLSIFSKYLFESDNYERVSQKGLSPIDFAINNFFGEIKSTEYTKFKDEKTDDEYIKPVERRIDSKGRKFIIDKKPTKSLESYIRKSFETNHTDISDLFSTNIILADEQYEGLPQDEKVAVMNNIAEEFFQYLKQYYPHFKTTISGDRNTFENYTSFKNGESVEKKGKRTGSESSRIVRRKMRIYVDEQDEDETVEHVYELVFYPFEKLSTISEGEMLGWMDKIADDPTYMGKRLMKPLQHAYGLSTLYGLFFHPSIYPELSRKMHNHSVLRKEPRNTKNINKHETT
jgi:hypothetical protein